MAKVVERNFKMLREVISPENVQVMAELITIKQTKVLMLYRQQCSNRTQQSLLRRYA